MNQVECENLDLAFWCPEGRCIPKKFLCNFYPECLHGEDEANCLFEKCDSNYQFQCSNGQCINRTAECDNQIDCYDKSDELNCEHFQCPTAWKQCKGGQCIDERFWCDYFQDCFDGSDELDCDYHKLPILCNPNTEFTCSNGQCISIENRCLRTQNTRQGCADGSHLFACQNYQCPINSTKCDKTYCVHQDLICNNILDCGRSWTDEENCRKLIIDKKK